MKSPGPVEFPVSRRELIDYTEIGRSQTVQGTQFQTDPAGSGPLETDSYPGHI